MKPFASKMLLWGFSVSALRLKGVDTDIFLIIYVFVGVTLSQHTILWGKDLNEMHKNNLLKSAAHSLLEIVLNWA